MPKLVKLENICQEQVFGTSRISTSTVFGTDRISTSTVFGTSRISTSTVFGTSRISTSTDKKLAVLIETLLVPRVCCRY